MCSSKKDCVVAPNFDELLSLAKIDGVSIRDISLFDGNELVARALAFSEQRRHHGLNVNVYSLYSGKLHDYSVVYVRDEEAGRRLWDKMLEDARSIGCDILVIGNVLVENSRMGGIWKNQEELKIFDVRKCKEGWSKVYNRTSVKRFIREAKKVGRYHVEVDYGALDKNLIMELGQLHVRRWGFEGSNSPFANNGIRVAQYLNHPENKTYMRVMLGDDILACHYGMVYGETLLWHTPVINPKYMRLSPLRILLAETARWCEKVALMQIDFGLGDEQYKNEYCNKIRATYFKERALSVKGFMAYLIGVVTGRSWVRVFFRITLNSARRLLSMARRITERWIFFYSSEPANDEIKDPLFHRICSWQEFCDFTSSRNFQIFKWQWERFKNDSTLRFVCLADGAHIFSYGWETYDGEVTNLTPKQLQGNRILYDFCTPQNFRRKGFYTRLLCKLKSDGTAVIYAHPSNMPSITAIKKAGFHAI